MEWTQVVALLIAGLAIGTVSGMIGIGGGILVIPILVLFFGFTQTKATGTSLAMLLPPIGIFAVIAYAREGNIHWTIAAILALGFMVGGYFGAWIVNRGWINPTAMRIAFALFLVYVAGNLLFRPGGRARVALETLLMVLWFAATYAIARLLGRRYMRMPAWGDLYRDRLKHHAPYDFEI
jgi:uncharacterized membrane protein YfcA